MIKYVSLLLVAALFLKMNSAQSNKVSLGVNFLIGAHTPRASKTMGAGINVTGEHYFSTKISGTLSAEYLFFKGRLTTWDNKEVEKFAMIPVLVGARLYVNDFFFAFESGVAIQANKNTGTNFILSPAIGYKKKRLDAACYLFGVPQAFASIPENTYFIKGGYSYVGLRISYFLSP